MLFKTYITSLLLMVIASSRAQVGIGTTIPHASSILDVTATNSGLLIPRVALTSTADVTTIASPATSLLVYNSGFAPNGYYYWNATVWVQLATGNNTDWSLTGNTGTSAATNFLGTTDNVDIVFKRNNFRAGFIGDATYDGSFNSNNGNTSLGANSLVNPTVNIGSQTGVRNTALGTNVMPVLTSGQRNTGIGDFSLFSNTSGTENTAIGSGALFSNTISSGHVAVGRNALTSYNGPNTASIGNTAVGFAALRNTINGISNTAIGFEALRNTTGSGSVGIGYQAGRLETGSNKLYIENSNADANNALVYGEFDTNIVRVNGTLQISNPASAPGYALPIVRGTSGQVLQTDGVGGTSWANSNNTLSVIRAALSGGTDQALTNAGWQKVTFNSTVFDTNAEFNIGSNRFVAIKAGYYQINAGFHIKSNTSTNQFSIGVRINNNFYQETGANHPGSGITSRNINCIVNLAVGDYVEIFVENTLVGALIDGYSGKTYFEVRQIR